MQREVLSLDPPGPPIRSSFQDRPWALFLLIFTLLIFTNLPHLTSPPYWDAANGLYFQGAWLAQNDLSLTKLLSQPDFAHCGPRYGSHLLIPWIYAVLLKLSSPPIALLSLHLLSLALWSATLSLLNFHLKNSDSNWLPALWTIALALQPSSAAQGRDHLLRAPSRPPLPPGPSALHSASAQPGCRPRPLWAFFKRQRPDPRPRPRRLLALPQGPRPLAREFSSLASPRRAPRCPRPRRPPLADLLWPEQRLELRL